MPGHEQFAKLPGDFAGVVRLFPLPNLVMFPGVLQPLHVFEPRYVEMLEDALADDRLIAMALLAPGWERDYEGRPPIAPSVCIGRVVSHTRTDEGKYNLLLLGARRARVTRELPPARSFRRAAVELLADAYPAAGAASRGALQQKLVESLRPFVSASAASQQQFQQLLASDVPLGLVADIVAHTLSLALPTKLELLGECNVDRRAELLIAQVEHMQREASAPRAPFPPKFSDN
jgi:ATP-dependent Lon protease